jgi:1-aminocyclopropane-1-carboxylate deaminase/D-cysteine desulfhydrase-like pyridoxal-dependent ACC family enzyme
MGNTKMVSHGILDRKGVGLDLVKTVSRMMSVLQQARQAGAATKREILFLVVFFEHQV